MENLEELFNNDNWRPYKPLIYIRKTIRDFNSRLINVSVNTELVEDDHENYPRINLKIIKNKEKYKDLEIFIDKDLNLNFSVDKEIKYFIVKDQLLNINKIIEVQKVLLKDLLLFSKTQ